MNMISLNGTWSMKDSGWSEWIDAKVPGSVYADLLDAGRMEDPYYRDNERAAFDLMKRDYIYRRRFTLTPDDLNTDALLLVFEGLDTIAGVFLNGEPVIAADNMHRTWEINILPLVKAGENEITVSFSSPINYVRSIGTPEDYGKLDDSAITGFAAIRKAHSMFGWDWGPRLPDAGIWRDVYLLKVQKARLRSVQIRQIHASGKVTLRFSPEIDYFTKQSDGLHIRYALTAPDGTCHMTEADQLAVESPQLWWPNGLGEQNLYTVKAELFRNSELLDSWERRIGLRTITMRREKDQWGESFEFNVNGVSFFSMGANYIPEDNILRRVSPERTRKLLTAAKVANFNTIRVWGGGYYPDDGFYDTCDELGLVVWQDFMFACCCYKLTEQFEASVSEEIRDNITRLRHHPSLGLWCGNNETEGNVMTGLVGKKSSERADYIKLFEYIIPKLIKKYDPDTFYWPSSPSSCGTFDDSNAADRGDVHFWDVWYWCMPDTEYRKYGFRFVSEFGFQAFPCAKTVESFTLPQDRNIFSRVMEKHQRSNTSNGRIMNHLARSFLYPSAFDTLLYASQLLQAQSIRYAVEHWRRNRGRCMGAIYWQLDDCWPVASWSSIDYFGRWKALHYYAARFFAPVLLSCCEEGILTQRPNINDEMPIENVVRSVQLNISNETKEDHQYTAVWALRHSTGEVVEEGSETGIVDAMSAVWLQKHEFANADLYGDYVSYALILDGKPVSDSTVLFCAPKHFNFVDPELEISAGIGAVTVTAHAYARAVEITCEDGDVILEDNYFDMNGGSRTVRIIEGSGTVFKVRSVFDIR